MGKYQISAYLIALPLINIYACKEKETSSEDTSVKEEAIVEKAPEATPVEERKPVATENPQKEFNFRQTYWGMNREQVKKSETMKPIDETDTQVVYSGNVSGMDAQFGYIFVGGKLVQAAYIFTEKHTNENEYISDYKKLKEILSRKYGTPNLDDQVWRNNLYRNDPDKWGFAISYGHLTYRSKWETEDSEISLVLYGDNYKVTLGATYQSKELKHLEKQEQIRKEEEEF